MKKILVLEDEASIREMIVPNGFTAMVGFQSYCVQPVIS